MTKKEASNLYRRIRGCIARKRFCVKLKSDPSIYGKVDWGTPDTLIFNPRIRSPIMRTIIHECLHLLDDDLSEAQVRTKEKELFEALSDRQLEGLLKKFMMNDLGV